MAVRSSCAQDAGQGAGRVLTIDQPDVLDQAQHAYPDLSYDECNHSTLAEITRQHGVDFATALFFDRVRRVPRNHAFARTLEAGHARQPVGARGKVLIVPALFYRRRPTRGGDGAVVRQVAERAGLDVEVVPVESGGSARRNAAIAVRPASTACIGADRHRVPEQGQRGPATGLRRDVGHATGSARVGQRVRPVARNAGHRSIPGAMVAAVAAPHDHSSRSAGLKSCRPSSLRHRHHRSIARCARRRGCWSST